MGTEARVARRMRAGRVAMWLLLAAAVTSARADEGSKVAKVEQLFRLSKMDALTEQSLEAAHTRTQTQTTQMLQQAFGMKLTEDQQKKMESFEGRLYGVLKDALSWQSLQAEYTQLYLNAYTEQQLDDLIAFYSSPTGQVMVDKTPILLQQATDVVQVHMSKAMPQITQLTQQAMAEMMPAQKSQEKSNESKPAR